MKMLKTTIAMLVLFGAVTMPAFAGEDNNMSHPPILGHWVTQGGNVIVDLKHCDAMGELCADIIWAEDAGDGADLNDRPILNGFKYQKGAWRGGKLWDAAAKKSYHARIRAREDGTLKLNACALGRCYEQIWTRPDATSASLEGYFAAHAR